MRHENSVFHALLKQVPWAEFDRLVGSHGSDYRVRRLSSKDQLVALLFGQLAGASSLREIEAGLASHGARLYHLGARPASRSTLADANAKRPAALFVELFARLVARAHPGLRRKLRGAVRLIDATGLPLNRRSAEWSRFSARACGAKAHVIYDPDADCPLYLNVTAANVNDITAAKAMPVEPGATYVFDLGYYDYAWWSALDRAGCRIVTRLKRNTTLNGLKSRALDPAAPAILADRTGRLSPRAGKRRKNPYTKPLREIVVRLDDGKRLRLISNDLNATATEIAELYKRRWAIELFFRWIKQNLKIRHFLGVSANAVRTQIAVALIAFVLLRLAATAQRFAPGALAFARLVRLNLMHRRPIDQLQKPPTTKPIDKRQLTFNIQTF